MFENLLKEYMPRAHCMFYEQDLIILNIIGDGLIFFSYLAIGGLMIWFSTKVPKLFNRRVMFLFGAFIFLCGLTHGMSVLAIWHTFYKIDGWLKILTGIVSLTTLLIAPNSLKRAKEMNEYNALNESAKEAKQKAAHAEEKAERLMEIIKQYESKV